ncbi:MAG: hypothetical protein H7268_15405 [Sandarakinorhabdus sp.]|nr:hypothetical protein [Sandarakinorhabdus sp.]
MILAALIMLQLSAAGPPPLVPQAPPPAVADPRDPVPPPAGHPGPPPFRGVVMMVDMSDDTMGEASSAITEPVSATGNTALWVDLPLLPATSRRQLAAIDRVGEYK